MNFVILANFVILEIFFILSIFREFCDYCYLLNFCEFPVYIQTLEDSQVVLDKLAFHRDSSKEAGSRLPRIFAGQTETYETLHKLLEEIELLLKVWKNRVNHPLTAHLERKVEERQVLEDEPDLPGQVSVPGVPTFYFNFNFFSSIIW